MFIQLPAGLKFNHVQMAKVVQEEYVLVGGTWLCPRVNITNIVHLSKHHTYYRVETESAKTGLLSAI